MIYGLHNIQGKYDACPTCSAVLFGQPVKLTVTVCTSGINSNAWSVLLAGLKALQQHQLHGMTQTACPNVRQVVLQGHHYNNNEPGPGSIA